MVWAPAVVEGVMAVDEPPVLAKGVAVLAPVASGQAAAVGNSTLALGRSLVSKASEPPAACRAQSRNRGTGLTYRRSVERLQRLLE